MILRSKARVPATPVIYQTSNTDTRLTTSSGDYPFVSAATPSLGAAEGSDTPFATIRGIEHVTSPSPQDYSCAGSTGVM
jgi:hypothetical protein